MGSNKVLYLVRFYLAYMLMIFFSHVNCFLVQYADDTQFLHSNTIDKLDHLIKDTEETLVKCRRYFPKNGLMLNSSKTQCVFIGNRQLLSIIPPNTTINFNGDIIYPSNHVKTWESTLTATCYLTSISMS